MISFQNMKTGLYFIRFETSGIKRNPVWTKLLADAMPYAQAADEDRMRRALVFYQLRTVTYSTRIDHPSNNLANLTGDELAARYPI